MEWILDRETHLNGVHLADCRLRPLRLAYIVPDDSPAIALRAIEACCLTWGGVLNPLIPYSKTAGLSQSWIAVLRKLDPDNLVDCAGMSEQDSKSFTEKGVYVHRWKKPLDSLFVVGVLQYSALKAFGKGKIYRTDDSPDATNLGQRQPRRKYRPADDFFLIQPVMAPNAHPLYFPLIARYGKLNEDFASAIIKEHHVWEQEIRYSDFANIHEHDFSTDEDGIYLYPALKNSAGGAFQYVTPLGLTQWGLTLQGASYSVGGGSPANPQNEEAYCDTVIVTGQADSVSDLCLYWNLRIERLGGLFPLWIPLEFLRTDKGLEVVKRAIGLHKNLNNGFGMSLQPFLYVTSTSMSVADLQRELDGKVQDDRIQVRYVGSEIERFVSGNSDVYLTRAEREVFFTNGVARVPALNHQALADFAFLDRYSYEVRLEGVRIPQSAACRARLPIGPRLSKRGFQDFLNQAGNQAGTSGMWRIQVPDGWTVLESVLADAGYACIPSDKGKSALGLIQLLGGIQGIEVISSSRVCEVLRDMSRTRGTEREFFADRQLFEYSRFREKWGRHTPAILDWLLKRDVVFRGIKLKCPKCQLTRWYDLDSANKVWRCDGCLSNQAIPLDLASTAWSYRINELYARGHDQGFIGHLLAINALCPRVAFSGSSFVGCYPGVKITATDDPPRVGDVEEMELDLVAILDGRLIIGECKDSGDTLTSNEVKRYEMLARHLNCSRVIFSTPTTFPQADQLFAQIGSGDSFAVEALENQDLFDTTWIDRLRDPDDVACQDRAETYLDWLIRQLQG